MTFDKNYDVMSMAELAAMEAELSDFEVAKREQRREAYAAAMATYGSHWNVPTAVRRSINALYLEVLQAGFEFGIVRSKYMLAAGEVGPGGPPIVPVPPGGGIPETFPDGEGVFIPPVPQPGNQRDPGDEG